MVELLQQRLGGKLTVIAIPKPRDPYGVCNACLNSDTSESVAQRVRERFAVLLRSLEAMGAVH